MQAVVKQPSETLKRPLPFDGGAAAAQLLGLAAESRGLVAGSVALLVSGSIEAGALIVELSGGTDGERYLVTGRIEDAAGEIHEAELELAVIDGEWLMPDGGAPYLSISDFVDRYGLEETLRMTDSGAGRIDRMLLTKALAAAQAIADVHISARYAVPLATVPEIVKLAIADMARARLYPRGAPDGIERPAKEALATLEKIGQGKLPLPSAAPIAAAPSSSPILIQPGRRQYPDGLLGY